MKSAICVAKTVVVPAALVWAFATCAVQAQTATPAKPAASKAAPAKKPAIVQATFAPAAPAAPKEKLMTRAELKACFERQAKNEADNKALTVDQDAYRKDYDAIKADQTALAKEQATNRERASEIATLRDEVNTANQAFAAKIAAVQKPTDEDRAGWAKEREALVARARQVDVEIAAYNEQLKATRERTAAVDARVPPINDRQKALNARVEPLQEAVKQWRADCADKAYDEADEIAVKKELGMK